MNEKNNIEVFKDTMLKGMLSNFEKDGYLAPMIFFYIDGEPIVSQVPHELLSTKEGKEKLALIIKSRCSQPNVLAGGIIFEADCVRIKEEEANTIEGIINGDIELSSLEGSKDTIVMMFSSPEKEELFTYPVDIENKKIKGKLTGEDVQTMGGLFTNLFQWIKN